MFDGVSSLSSFQREMQANWQRLCYQRALRSFPHGTHCSSNGWATDAEDTSCNSHQIVASYVHIKRTLTIHYSTVPSGSGYILCRCSQKPLSVGVYLDGVYVKTGWWRRRTSWRVIPLTFCSGIITPHEKNDVILGSFFTVWPADYESL